MDPKDPIHYSKWGACTQAAHLLTQILNQKVSPDKLAENILDKKPNYQKVATRMSHKCTSREAAVVIGRGGQRIRAMKEKHDVQIETENVGQNTIFQIRGDDNNCMKALMEIRQIIANTVIRGDGIVRQPRSRNPAPTRPCRNYATGHCRWGNNCRYLHDISQEPESRDSSRDRSPLRDRSPVRIDEQTAQAFRQLIQEELEKQKNQ